MKTLALFAALLAAAPASASDRTGDLSLGLSGGAALPLGAKSVKENAKLGPDYGVSLSYGLSEHFEASLSYDSVQMHKTRPVRVEPWLFSIVHTYDHGGYWMPIVRVGAGTAVVHGTRPLDLQSYSTLAARAGAGFEYRLTPAVGLGAMLDYLYAARANHDTREVHAAVFSLALSWHLGKPRAASSAKAAAAPAAAPEKAAAAPTLKDTYKQAISRERREKVLMVWVGESMSPAPAGFENPLTDEAVAAGWRPVLADGKVAGACDGDQCTSESLQPDLFKHAPSGKTPGQTRSRRGRTQGSEPAVTPDEVQAPPVE